MKLRDISIFTGEKFAVPQHIQRIDSKCKRGLKALLPKAVQMSSIA